MNRYESLFRDFGTKLAEMSIEERKDFFVKAGLDITEEQCREIGTKEEVLRKIDLLCKSFKEENLTIENNSYLCTVREVRKIVPNSHSRRILFCGPKRKSIKKKKSIKFS